METENKRRTARVIGKKIKEVRLSEGMTQRELAGNIVSRNMLSMIESGNALPSLETLMHISETLSVPTGFFFADENEIKLLGKGQVLENVYRHLENSEFDSAAKLCSEYADGDTEMRALLTVCHIKTAEHYINKYYLASAANYIHSAMEYAEALPYIGDSIIKSCKYTLDLFDCVSKDDIPDSLTDFKELSVTRIPYEFSAYLAAYRSIKNGDSDTAAAALRLGMFDEFYSLHIRGGILMNFGDFAGATTLFDLALTSDGGGFFSRYKLLCDLEVCRKNAGDFEQAYSLSTSRMEMLGMFSE